MTRDSVQILFVNTHTLKGAARALQFRELANVLHKVESYYSSILKDNQEIDQVRAQRGFSEARAVYQRYVKANRDILGRVDDGKKVSVDREFLHGNVKFLRQLDEVAELPRELKTLIHSWRHELTQLVFTPLPVILEDIMLQAKTIARDLGREPPRIELEAEDIMVSYSQELALKNAFIHLLRNALDHGIEPADIRLKKGKPAQGTIRVRAWQHNDTIQIEFQDDGRGLALGRIRSMGKIEPTASPETIAAQIFESGFSTTETVSQMSGRGIGMSAVLQFLAGEHGTATMILGQPLDAQSEFRTFTICLTLPSLVTASQRLNETRTATAS
jgi:chemotaxis protein histidine kinase CheA